MYIMSDAYMESSQPLNLVQPSKSKAKMMARAVASQWSLRQAAAAAAAAAAADTGCQCPPIDSKSTILYRLLTDSYFNGAPCACAGPHCHNSGVPICPRESKLKILLEESKKQAVQS
jgi:hypothetical protein